MEQIFAISILHTVVMMIILLMLNSVSKKLGIIEKFNRVELSFVVIIGFFVVLNASIYIHEYLTLSS